MAMDYCITAPANGYGLLHHSQRQMATDYYLTTTGNWSWTTASRPSANGYGLLPHSHRQMAMDYCLTATGR